MKIRAHIYISGFVQGVFFRACTRDEARRAQVTGWVRNLSDGRVEAMLEGEDKDVEGVINWSRIGPPGARVKDVAVTYSQYIGEFNGFEVRYRG